MSSSLDQSFLQDARKYWALILRRKGLIATCLLVSLGVATVYNYTTRPVYRGTVQILIDKAIPKVLPIREMMEPGVSDFQTEYQLIRGRALLEKVVAKLDLQMNPELATGPTMSPWERFQRKFLTSTPTPPIDSDGIPLTPAVAALRSRIGVDPMPGGRLVNLRFDAYDPGLAARVANTLAETYIEESVNFRFSTTTAASSFLGEQVTEQKRRLEMAETALAEFRKKHGLIDVNDQNGGSSDQAQALDSAVMSARMQRIAKESLFNQLKGMTPQQLASSAGVMASPAVQEARQKVSAAQAVVAQLSETFGDRHPDMVQAKATLRDAEEKLKSECQSYVRSLQGEYQVAASQEATLAANLESTRRHTLDSSGVMVELGVLKREVEAQKQLVDSLMGRAKETGLETELKSTNVRIMERAEVPSGPFLPKRNRNLQLAFVIGLALGVGLTLLFEQLDNTIKTPDDVKEHLGLPFLGMVPDVNVKTSPAGTRPSPLIMKSPQSAVAEAYRVVRTNLVFSSAESTGRVFLVSSANPGEGKTTTTVNLASSLAMSGARVLAVDADLRRPTMHQHFGVNKAPGLSDLIVGKCQPSEAVQDTRFKGLQVLPCGYIPPNPAELLASPSMRQIVAALRTHYDWVLIDTPPILAMADTPVLASLVDGLVLVTAAEVTPRPSILRAVDQIHKVNGKVVGVVLNKVNLERNAYYYSQYYGEYYRSYYTDKLTKERTEPRLRAVSEGGSRSRSRSGRRG